MGLCGHERAVHDTAPETHHRPRRVAPAREHGLSVAALGGLDGDAVAPLPGGLAAQDLREVEVALLALVGRERLAPDCGMERRDDDEGEDGRQKQKPERPDPVGGQPIALPGYGPTGRGGGSSC